jgi:hypothetical protein
MPPCLVDGCAEGVAVNWRPLIEFLVSVGYGLLSSIVPIFNCEIYIVASQVGGFTQEVTTAVGCAVGQAIGKVGIVLALRRGSRSGVVRRLRERRDRPRKPAGRVRTRLRAWSDRLLGLLGERRWGGAHRLPLRLSRDSAAVCGDPRRAGDQDVGHPLRRGRASRADGAVSRHSLRSLGIGQLSPHSDPSSDFSNPSTLE